MRQQGVVTAFVREVDAEHGRIRVEYRGRDQALHSPWAPIASAMSGSGRGALFMPEQGDEVLVAFHDGSFDRPFVVGFLWNGEQRSPEQSEHNRVIVTPGGHQLRFEDREGDRRVVLRSAGGRSLTLDDKVGATRVELKSESHTVTLDDNPGAARIVLQAGQGVGVTITMNTTPPSLSISVGAGNTIEVGPSGVTLTTPSSVNVTCSSANLTAGTTTLSTGVLNVNAAVSNFAGIVMASTVIASSAVVSPLYSPGIGNLL